MKEQQPQRRRPVEILSSNEHIGPQEVGIFNETDRLRSATIWGPVGAEAVLAQLYPEEVSLFYAEMDVVKARKETDAYAEILRQHGVHVISARDVLAHEQPDQPLHKDEILAELIAKAQEIIDENPTKEEKKDPAKKAVRFEKSKQAITELLEGDIERYGEQQALALNKELCLDIPLPVGNALYARDQMNVLLGTRFVSRMKYGIRIPEVALYERTYEDILAVGTNSVEIPEGETFEGGDAYVHNNTVYVGVGIRTTKKAAEFMFSVLEPQLAASGMRFAIVEDKDPKSRPKKAQMDFMHLDTFSGPIGDTEIAVCEEEAKRRMVSYLERGEDGSVATVETGDNFLDHLQKQGETVVIIPREEQESFGCNFLALDENTLLLPLESNQATNERLQELGKNLVFLGLYECTRGYGASHCMTGQLSRKR